MSKEYIGATASETVTASDTANFAGGVCRAIYVGGAGNVNVVYESGATQVYTAVPAGTILMVQAKRVNATSTTATNMVAMF